MNQTKKIPLWVMLAFSNIRTRKSALLLILASVVFSLYCIPWAQLFSAYAWLSSIFLIEDWSWFAMMVPVVGWYLLCLRWMDRNLAWEALSS